MAPTKTSLWFMPALIGVGLITLTRILVLWVSPTDLYVDESQYWLWGQDMDFGYYSKPPMIGWVLRAFDEMAAQRSAFTVRLPAPLFHGATALILGAWAQRFLPERPWAGFWVAMTYLSLPIVAVGSFLISTDTIMAPFLSGALLFYWRICEGGSARHAVAGGVLLGLGFLSKYAAVYFLPGAIIAYILFPSMRPNARLLGLYALAFLLAASPNIIWNIANDLTTVSHTMDNIGWVKEESVGPTLNFAGFFEFTLSQFAVFGPVFMGIWLIALFSAAPGRRRALLWFSIPVWSIVLLQALLSRAYANWAFAAILPATLIVVLWALERRRLRLLWSGLAINLAICLIIPALVVFPMAFKSGDGQPVAKRYINVAAISHAAFDLAHENGLKTVVASNRGILADFFFTGAESDLNLHSTPPKGPPRHYYEQEKFLPADLSGDVLYVSYGGSLSCDGQTIEPVADLAQGIGTWSNRALPAYIVDAECLR